MFVVGSGSQENLNTKSLQEAFLKGSEQGVYEEALQQHEKLTKVALQVLQHLDESNIFQLFTATASIGCEKVVEFMLKCGLKLDLNKNYNHIIDPPAHQYTPVGIAIQKAHLGVVEVFLNYGYRLDDVSRFKWMDVSALEHFFSFKQEVSTNPQLLELILRRGPKLDTLKSLPLYEIARYASCKELYLLLEAGLDPNAATNKTSLLTFCVNDANDRNRLVEHLESIQKVEMLLKYGVRFDKGLYPSAQNYLHQTSHPTLIRLFCEAGLDIKAKALFKNFYKETFKPIDIAHSEEAVKILCHYGEDRENAPYIPGTRAHRQALERLGITQENKEEFFKKKGADLLVTAHDKRDMGAFMALLGAGINVNQTLQRNKVTCLHYLYLKLQCTHEESTRDAFATLASNIELHLIHLLFVHGAIPLKDFDLQTPLFYLTRSRYCRSMSNYIISQYAHIEADYYKLDRQEYKKKLLEIRAGDTPAYSVDKFWKSFISPDVTLPPPEFWPHDEDKL